MGKYQSQNNFEWSDFIEERWVPVYGYEDEYEVSDHGHVYSKRLGRNLKSYVNENGYVVVALYNGKGRGGQRLHKVHRLMMLSFYGPDPDRPIVNHIDGNKRKNILSNLEWTTSRENNLHAVKTGLRDPAKRCSYYRVQYKEIDEIVKGGPKCAELLHKHGYFIDVDPVSLKSRLIVCAKNHTLYRGVVKVEDVNDPFNEDHTHPNAAYINRSIRARLPSGLIVKAKGSANLYDTVRKFGYWRNIDRSRSSWIKRIGECCVNGRLCEGISVWYV